MALLCLSISSSFAQDHSTCALADALTIGGTMCVDENGSGPNSGDPTGFDNTDGNVCSSNYSGGDDYIFSYTATSADGLQLDLFATNTWTGVLVTEGCPTTGTCFASSTSSSSDESLLTPAMTVGVTYYIHISTYPSPQSSGQFCMDASLVAPPMAPANDECGDAEGLTVNADEACGTVTSGTIAAATASGEDETTCSGTENDDVWYSFTATSQSHTIDLLNVANGTTDLYHSVWSGTCGALTNILCSDPNSSTATGLTIGETYLLRVYSWTSTSGQTSTFDVCIGTPPAPPANNECDSPATLTESADDSCGNSVSGTTENALNSPGTCSTFGREVWYAFTPAMTTNYNFSVTETFESGSFTSTYVSVWSGACGSLTQLGSTSCFTTSVGDVALDMGTTYYVVVRSSSSTNYTEFDLCAYPSPAPPDNDACADAEVVQVNADEACGAVTSGTIASATASGEDETTCSGTEDDDVWFSFTASAVEHTIDLINVANGTTDLYHSVWSGTCGNLTNLVCSDPNSSTVSGLTIGTEYLLRVYSWTGTSGQTTTFDVCIGTPPPPPPPPSNDACMDAIDMTNGVVEQGTIESATDVEGLSPCSGGGGGDTGCGGGTGSIDWSPGVWFSYTATGPDTITIDLSGSLFDTEVQVFSGSCGNLTCVGGDDDGGEGVDSKFCWVSNASFAPVTYYIYVDGHAGATGIYDAVLTVQQPVLPIELMSFDAKAMEQGNKVEWTTASEVNNQFQIVEKSYGNKGDWMEVGRIESKGDSDRVNSYEMMDTEPARLTYYRLRSVDHDGYVEYSEVVSVAREGRTNKLMVSPNPTAGLLNIETTLENAGAVTMTIVDMSGKIIDQLTISRDAGTAVTPYDMTELPTGMYILNVQTGSQTFVEKIIKE